MGVCDILHTETESGTYASVKLAIIHSDDISSAVQRIAVIWNNVSWL